MLLIVTLAVLSVLGLCLIWCFVRNDKMLLIAEIVAVYPGAWCFYHMGIQPMVSVALAGMLAIIVGMARVIWDCDEEIWQLRHQNEAVDEEAC